MWDGIWTNARIATMDGAPPAVLDPGALATEAGRIAWVGPAAAMPQAPACPVHDCGGRWMTPGLIDCHTHLVHGGDRAREFAMRLAGASYEEIARAGGGIVSTVAATRAADEEALLAAARPRLAALAREGVTTIEIKSGYGLATADEARMLRVAGLLGAEAGLRVVRTFLGAHAVPPEYRGRQAAFVELVCGTMLDEIAGAGLADAVDAFGERIAFSPAEVARVFQAAHAHGLPVKLHADQLSDQGGAALAARFGALSADHLEYAGEAGIAAMAAAGTVAVLLPGAFHMLRERQVPPVAAMRREGVPMALATDCNPGSSPVTSLLLMMNMGCVLFGLTTEEALAAVTVNAARALGLSGTCGRLAPGLAADFVLWDVADLAELAYRLGFNPVRQVVVAGVPA